MWSSYLLTVYRVFFSQKGQMFQGRNPNVIFHHDDGVKVIPLKLFYYQTFFETWAWLTFMIWTLKKCNKKLGSLCLFTCQRALKMGYFYWLPVKIRITFIQSKVLVTLKDTKFYLESKASYIDISSIASLKLFLIGWLREYCTFSDSSVVSLKSWPWPKYIQ